MGCQDFSFHEILRMILADTATKPSALATALLRERTLIYKWLSGRHVPGSSYIQPLADFVQSRATASQKIVLTGHLEAYIRASALPRALQEVLLTQSGDFTLFLKETLSLSINRTWSRGEESTLVDSRKEPGISVHIWAVMAAVAGGALWNLMNHLFGWTYYMGSLGNDAPGLPAFIWGAVTTAPVLLVFILSMRLRRPALWLACVLYTLAGGFAALLFYQSGIRPAVESFGWAYSLQELCIVLIYAAIIATPPYLVFLLFFRATPAWNVRSLCICMPVAAACVAVAAALSINRPVEEIVQLKGLLVGLAIRIFMYYALLLSFKPGLSAKITLPRRA